MTDGGTCEYESRLEVTSLRICPLIELASSEHHVSNVELKTARKAHSAVRITMRERADESLSMIATITRAKTRPLATMMPTQINEAAIEAIKSLRLPPR